MATNISNLVFQSGANTPAVNLVNGDTLNLLSTGLVVATGTGASPGVLAAGSNTFNLSGDVLSLENVGITASGGGIRGGLGVDLFGFNVGDNGDLIQAFNEGGVRDGFDLRGYFNATGFAGNDPRGAGILQVLQNGADTDVYLHGAFAFRIEGAVAAAIDDSYFLFQ